MFFRKLVGNTLAIIFQAKHDCPKNSAWKSSNSSQAVKCPSTAETALAIYFLEAFAHVGGKLWLAWDFIAMLHRWGDPALLSKHPSDARRCHGCAKAFGKQLASQWPALGITQNGKQIWHDAIWLVSFKGGPGTSLVHVYLPANASASPLPPAFRPPFAISKLFLQCSYGALYMSSFLGQVLHSARTQVMAAFGSILESNGDQAC